MKSVLKILRKIPIFRGLTEEQMKTLLAFLKEENFDLGEQILTEYEADEDAKMYVILSGGVEVLKKALASEEEEISLNFIKPGESFGEMGLVDVLVRSATVRAVAPTRVLSLSRKDLNRIFELHPRIYGILMRNIAQQISKRLRRADALQASLLYKQKKEEEKSQETKKDKSHD